MKILVTGICGRLGRAIAAEAERQQHTIVGVDQIPWPSEHPLPAGVEVFSGSYEDISSIEGHLKSCDALIHTAGPHGGHVKRLTLGQFIHGNVESVANLLECAVRCGVKRAVLSSTMEILFGRDYTASGIAILDEECPPRSDSSYSTSRLLQEHLAREFCRKYPISIASLRYMVFGYDQDENLGLLLLARGLSPRDVARAVLAAAARDDMRGDIFHIGPETPLTNRDIVEAMTNPAAVIERYYPGASAVLAAKGLVPTFESFWPVTSIRKARAILGWRPEFTFADWLRQQGWTELVR